MSLIQATPIRSAISQENTVPGQNIKSFTTGAQSIKSLKFDATRKKGLSTQLNFTPSARRKLGNVSNTPIAGASGSLKPGTTGKKHTSGLARKEDSFVKPLNFGPAVEATKKAVAPSLPTVYEDIENMFPVEAKQLREDADPCITVGLWEKDLSQMPFDSDDESQKENRNATAPVATTKRGHLQPAYGNNRYKAYKMESRLMTVDELCDLF